MATAILSTVTKASRLLELFCDTPEMSLSDCARAMDIPRPSAHRLLVTLVSTGMLERTTKGRYQLGMRMFEIGALAPYRRRLYDASCLALEHLVDGCGLPSHLAVLDGTEILYMVKAHRVARDLTETRAGSRRPAYATAMGKVMLAHAPEDALDVVLAAGLPRLTRHTVTVESRLRSELADIRRLGYGCEREEVRLGCASIAVPVRGPDGDVIAALSIAGPAARIGGRLAGFAPALHRASVAVEGNLARAAELEEPVSA